MTQRQISGQRRDLDLRPECESAGFQRPVDAALCDVDRFDSGAADEELEPDIRGDRTHDVPASRHDRMDANVVLIAEGLADRVDARERDVGRIERIDPLVGCATGVARASDVADELRDHPVVRAADRERTVIG